MLIPLAPICGSLLCGAPVLLRVLGGDGQAAGKRPGGGSAGWRSAGLRPETRTRRRTVALDEAWRVCPLLPGSSQEAPGGLGLERGDTPEPGPDSLGGEWEP